LSLLEEQRTVNELDHEHPAASVDAKRLAGGCPAPLA
jgi:hypothetical protein